MNFRNNSKSIGSGYTTLFREYDPEIARWKSLDPKLKDFPSESPFSAMGNNPIMNTDPDGDAVPVIVGRFLVGAGIEYGTQIARNIASDNTKTGWVDKTWNILFKGCVDIGDIGIGGLTTIAGGKFIKETASMGTKIIKTTALEAGAEVTKQYTGSQRDEDFLNFKKEGVTNSRIYDLAITIFGSTVGLKVGDKVHSIINKNSVKAKEFDEPIKDATKNALTRERKIQYTKLQKLQDAQKAVGSVAGEAAGGVASTIPKIIFDSQKSIDRGGGR